MVTPINIPRASVPENALWVLLRWGERNAPDKDSDETEHWKNEDTGMPEF